MSAGASTADRIECGCVLHAWCGRYGCAKAHQETETRDGNCGPHVM